MEFDRTVAGENLSGWIECAETVPLLFESLAGNRVQKLERQACGAYSRRGASILLLADAEGDFTLFGIDPRGVRLDSPTSPAVE